MFGTIRKLFTSSETPQSSGIESAKSRHPTDDKVQKAAPAAIPSKAAAQAKAAPKIRELSPEEKGSGVVFNVAKQFRQQFYNFCKGEDPRDKHAKSVKEPLGLVSNAMDYIQGASLFLQSQDGVCLEGKHFTLENLLSRMRDAGGQKADFRYTETKRGQSLARDFSGFVFDKTAQADDLIAAMTTMGFLRQIYQNGQGNMVAMQGPWEKQEVDGKIYIWKTDSCPKPCNSKNLQVVAQRPIEPQKSRSTIVLNGGIHSYYESHRTASEVAHLMALGFDVVVSQDKHPELLGSEAHEHVMANRRSIHEYLQKVGIANEQIIWKGTCFSAIPAVEAAAQFPGSHVVIDQGYVDSVEQTADYLFADILKPVLKPMLQGCIESALDAFHFNYNMAPHLPNVQGKVCIIQNLHDNVVSAQNVDKMRQLLGGKEHELCTISNAAVKHAGGWYEDKGCSASFAKFLAANNFSSGSLI